MSASSDNEFVTYAVDLMQSIGPVHAKRMFGGYGIFLDDLMFGLVADDILYLKADMETINEFSENDLKPFTYKKKGKELKISYYQAPEETLENSEVMGVWANKAYSVALRAASNKRSKKRK